jgi:hypothetical protein
MKLSDGWTNDKRKEGRNKQRTDPMNLSKYLNITDKLHIRLN